MRNLSIIKSLFLSAIVLLGVNSAHAVPMTGTALDYSGAGNPGVGMQITANGTFQTLGDAALSSFLNWADFLPVVDGVGKIRISGVQLTGNVLNLGGALVQDTAGGFIEALDNANNVILSATFTAGKILVSQSGTGSQFTVGLATFGGQLASYFIPDSATHSLSLINWNPFVVNEVSHQIGESSGYGNGLIAGSRRTDVPEPATMLLLGSGILGAAIKRRKA